MTFPLPAFLDRPVEVSDNRIHSSLSTSNQAFATTERRIEGADSGASEIAIQIFMSRRSATTLPINMAAVSLWTPERHQRM